MNLMKIMVLTLLPLATWAQVISPYGYAIPTGRVLPLNATGNGNFTIESGYVYEIVVAGAQGDTCIYHGLGITIPGATGATISTWYDNRTGTATTWSYQTIAGGTGANNSINTAGNGGDAMYVRDSGNSLMVAAGGGGGAGTVPTSGAAGLPTSTGTVFVGGDSNFGGQGGQATAGGIGGNNGAGGYAGSGGGPGVGTGGYGVIGNTWAGGGGGAGYTGGGGGSSAASGQSGGGGSSLVHNNMTMITPAVANTDPSANITVIEYSTCGVMGTVTDTSNVPLNGVTISYTINSTPGTTTTNAAGEYYIAVLQSQLTATVEITDVSLSQYLLDPSTPIPSPFTIILTNQIETADFKMIPPFDLTLDSSVPGTVTYSVNSVSMGTLSGTVQIEANASVSLSLSDPSNSFERWLINGTDAGSSNPLTFTMDENKTISAVSWMKIDLFNSDGSLTGGSPYYTFAGTTLTFASDAPAGKRYYVWQSTNSYGYNTINIIVNASVVTTVVIDDITISDQITLNNAANLKLLLKGDNTVTQGIRVPVGRAINIDSFDSSPTSPHSTNGSLTITTPRLNDAGIGGDGTTPNAGTIIIDGGTLDVSCNNTTNGSGAAGIGGGGASVTGGSGGNITINGGSVFARGRNGAAIGGGTVIIGSGSGTYTGGSGGTITINGGTVIAVGGAGGAGIGGGGQAGTSNITAGNLIGGSGGTITINDGNVTATSSSGAGIGGGAISFLTDTNSTTGGAGGTINIQGGTVTATGGMYGSGIGGAHSNKNNGGAVSGAGATLTINSAATVYAYSRTVTTGNTIHSLPAIHASSVNASSGYFVNAQFTTAPSTTAATTLEVFAGGVNTKTLTLSENYRSFAYTTGSTGTQNDNIYAYNATTGIPMGQVLQDGGANNNSPLIPSVRSTAVQAVKLGAAAGIPSVTNITQTSADFVSTGHVLNGATFSGGGFRYGTDPTVDSNGMLVTATPLTWSPNTNITPQTLPVSGLTPNTVYYMQTMLTTNLGTVYSKVFSFITQPEIATASVVPGFVAGEMLVSATFSGGDAPLTAVTIYWDTNTIDPGNPASWTTHASTTLPSSAYDHTGFSDFSITGLTPGTTYFFLIVVENQTYPDESPVTTYGMDTYLLKSSMGLTLTVFLEGATGTVPLMTNYIQVPDDYMTCILSEPRLPLTDPYGMGASCPNINDTSAATGQVVDWIQVMILGNVNVLTPPYSCDTLEMRALLLKPDGSVVDVDGNIPLFTPQAGPVHIVVKHRNHLAVMSQAVADFSVNVMYDFSASGQAYQSHSNDPMVSKAGVYCMWAGDVNGDDVIDAKDQTQVRTDLKGILFDRYIDTDLNMDGITDNVDAAIMEAHSTSVLYSPMVFFVF